ncbi:uncharacterized protein [Montipora capricornis]|uniref:uncharacterized protein isoform X1 n=1 Tax=Montipora capricornis TaxID=246305 RepID=UPI0035F1F144
MATNIRKYCERFVLPQPGDWPAQFYPRRIVYSSKTEETVRSSIVPLIGPLHIALNGQENVFRVFYELLRYIYQFVFSKSKPFGDRCQPWRISLVLGLTHGGWSLIRDSILSVFGEKCKDLQFLTLINFLENYVPLVLTIYAVIFRSNNCMLYVSALKRIWLMFFCFARHHYDKSPLVFLSNLLYWDKIGHPLHHTFRNSVLVFTEYPVEYFHSIIRDQTSPHSTPQQITNTCRSIFASNQRQKNFRQTFLPTKNYVLSRNQLKSAKLKAAEALKNTFHNIISKPNSSYSANATDKEKREWMLPCLFGNKFKSNKVLPCGFHLSPSEELEPDLLRECDLPNCQRQNDMNWRVFKGCGQSFHVVCVSNLTCPICQEGIQRHVRENAKKAKQAIFSTSSTRHKRTSSDTTTNTDDTTDNDESSLACLNDRELVEKCHNLNVEITSWPKYSTNVVRSKDDRPPTQKRELE